MVERVGLVRYKAWIILRRLADSQPLPEAENVADPELWFRVGSVVRRFHDAGLNHVDLNCDNILVAPDGVYLIDFDRCDLDRKSTRLNSSHVRISYAVFCLKKKKKKKKKKNDKYKQKKNKKKQENNNKI